MKNFISELRKKRDKVKEGIGYDATIINILFFLFAIFVIGSFVYLLIESNKEAKQFGQNK